MAVGSLSQGLEEKQYDLIIVGGGLAGLVLASKLSEVQDKSILVLEAGKDRRGEAPIDVPGMVTSTWGNKDYDWDFQTEPQVELGGRRIPQPRGKCLGGSSAINVTAIAYPTRRDFDLWTQLGNRGWDYETLQPYFERFQNYTPASQSTQALLNLGSKYSSSRRNLSGPVHTSHPDVFGPLQEAWMKSFADSGVGNDSDPYEFRKLGAFVPPNTVNAADNKRSYAASAYLSYMVASRANLQIITDAEVTRVILEESQQGVVAKGVELPDPDGNLKRVFANEVILSAGTFASPKILELSGVGSAEILASHGIDVKVSNPQVGEGLQDHCFSSVSFELQDGYDSMDAARDPAIIQAALAAYQESHSGPLSGVPYSLAYAPAVDYDGKMTSNAVQTLVDGSLNVVDTELKSGVYAQRLALSQLLTDPQESVCYYSMIPAQMHVKEAPSDTSMQENMAPVRAGDHLTISVGLNHPLARGSVHIKSASADIAPAIDPKYLSHPLDVELLARGMQFIHTLVEHPSFAAALKADSTIPSEVDFSSLEQVRKMAKERLWTTYHPTSTCAMLPKHLGGVVNDHLQVYGVQGLRVVDASAFPMITLGNIQATVYAFAERASDIIKDDWKKCS